MKSTLSHRLAAVVIAATVALLSACVSSSGNSGDENLLSIVGFAVPEQANKAMAADFTETEAGAGVTFSGSYGASGDQSRKVEAGAAADYVHFSLEGDVARLVEDGLVASDWDQGPDKGIVSKSVVVLVVPEGNPDNVTGWEDLTRDDIEIVTPDPAASGSARWNILGAYGHTLAEGKSKAQTADYLRRVFANVRQWAGSGREATEAFDNGIGNVLISYENEAILARQSGREYDYIVPDDTLLIENPGAVLKEASPKAQDWLDFVTSDEGQTSLVRSGFRPLDEGTRPGTVDGANTPADPFPRPDTLLTIDDFGGWPAADRKFFADGALVPRLRAQAARQ